MKKLKIAPPKLFTLNSEGTLGAVQVSCDQDGGMGRVCQMITLDHKGEGEGQPNDHMITHQGGRGYLDSIYVFNLGHSNS